MDETETVGIKLLNRTDFHLVFVGFVVTHGVKTSRSENRVSRFLSDKSERDCERRT